MSDQTPVSLLIAHPEDQWRFELDGRRYWLSDAERSAPTPRDFVHPLEPATTDDVSFSLRGPTWRTYGPPLLRVRVLRPRPGASPVDYLLPAVRESQEAGNEVTLETVRSGGFTMRRFVPDPDWETVYLWSQRGYVVVISSFGPRRADPAEIEPLLAAFEVRP